MTAREHQCLVAGCTGLACFGYRNPAEPEKMRWACGEHRGLLEHGEDGPSPALRATSPARGEGSKSGDLFWRSD
jgi:hypothetical protein